MSLPVQKIIQGSLRMIMRNEPELGAAIERGEVGADISEDVVVS